MKIVKYLKSTTSVVLLLLSSGCNAEINSPKITYDNAFEFLYLALGGLEYPADSRTLKICQEKTLKSCLSVYNSVQQAKTFIQLEIKKNKKSVFSHITNTITQKCTKKTASDSNSSNTCIGAIMAFYFFNDVDYDKKLQQFVANINSSILALIFRKDFEWMYNRPDANQWITLINQLPAAHLDADHKKTIIFHFKESQQPYDKFGLML